MYKKKTVLFYVSFLGLGGVAVALKNLIHELEASGFECKIMLPYESLIDAPYQFDVVPKKYLVATAWKKPIRSNIFRQILKLLNILSGWRFFFMGVPKIEHDIFVVYQALGSEHWSRYSSKPSFGWSHGLASKGSGFQGMLTRWDKKNSLSKFTRLIAVSHNVAENWKALYQMRTLPEVVFNFFNVDQMIKDGSLPQGDIKPSNRAQLIFLGRLFREKGLLRLLKCLDKLLHDYRIHFDLWVVGRGKEEMRLREFLSKSSIADNVHFLGYKANPYPYLRAADMLAVPSYEEGFGMVIWEALLQECPVMATDAGGCAQALNNGKWGMVVKNEDSAIYDGLKRFFADKTVVYPHEDFDCIKNCIKKINDTNKQMLVEMFSSSVGLMKALKRGCN